MYNHSKNKSFSAIILLLILCLLSFALVSCKEQVKEDPKAEFSGQTRMYADEGISIIMDNKFVKYSPGNCQLACENGDLKFEAFYLEKFYFEEAKANVNSAAEALEFVNPAKADAPEIKINSYSQAYTEFLTPDTLGTENNIRMYYVCIEDGDKYWFCTFFAYEKNFEEYRPKIEEYLKSLKPHNEE